MAKLIANSRIPVAPMTDATVEDPQQWQKYKWYQCVGSICKNPQKRAHTRVTTAVL
jgi:hypothetical protein